MQAPVPVVEERPGGAANVARNCAALGARVTLLSVVGADEAGHSLAQLLGEFRHRVQPARGCHAQHHGQAARDRSPAAAAAHRFENAPDHEVLQAKLADFESRLANCDVVILSDYGKGGLAHITEMISLARTAGKQVLVDPKGEDYARYAGATLLTPNRSEFRAVAGRWKDDAELAQKADRLRRELQLEALLVTRSEEGMTLFSDAGTTHEPALAREVYDVSGAGDTVIATLAVMLGSGLALSQAMRQANLAAGVVVGKLGTATCSLEELKQVN
jgi:rfaE bifunctional protein kinase chain/domain